MPTTRSSQASSDAATGVVSGGCLCGAIRFDVALPTLWCAHCHCTLCQRAHGAAFVTWVGVDGGGLSLEGSGTLSWYRSSEQARRGFCSKCGTTLFFESERWPGEVHIVRTAFDGEIDRLPGAHVFFSSHASWFPFQDDLERRQS